MMTSSTATGGTTRYRPTTTGATQTQTQHLFHLPQAKNDIVDDTNLNHVNLTSSSPSSSSFRLYIRYLLSMIRFFLILYLIHVTSDTLLKIKFKNIENKSAKTPVMTAIKSPENMGTPQDDSTINPIVEKLIAKQRLEKNVKSILEALVSSGKAVQATIRPPSYHDNQNIQFEMVLYPPSVDKIITPQLQATPIITYEQDVTSFISYVVETEVGLDSPPSLSYPSSQQQSFTYVDLGVNVGYHSLFVASLSPKIQIYAFEPAQDTATLFKGSLELNPNLTSRITLLEAGASNTNAETQLTLSRHDDSPGLTTLTNREELPWSLKDVKRDEDDGSASDTKDSTTTSSITLVRVEDVLDHYEVVLRSNTKESLPSNLSNTDHLMLLKVDVEGYELFALQGINLSRYKFKYILVEYFPQLLRASSSASATSTVDRDGVTIQLLHVLVVEHNYFCIDGWKTTNQDKTNVNQFDVTAATSSSRSIGATHHELELWVKKFDNSKRSHTNIYCILR